MLLRDYPAAVTGEVMALDGNRLPRYLTAIATEMDMAGNVGADALAGTPPWLSGTNQWT